MLRITLAAVLWIATAQFALAQPVTLKLSFFTSDQNEIWTQVLKPFIDAVNAEPGGAVKIEGFPWKESATTAADGARRRGGYCLCNTEFELGPVS